MRQWRGLRPGVDASRRGESGDASPRNDGLVWRLWFCRDCRCRFGERDERWRGGRRAWSGCPNVFAGGESGGGLSDTGRTRTGRPRSLCQPAPADASSGPSRSGRGFVLVNQRGLQFVPRVQAIALGQTVRFTNQDGETHNVHVVSPGFAFNQSMAPGQFQDFTPDRPGVMRLACDIHHAHAGLRGRQPDALGAGLRSGGAVPARRSSRRPLHLDRLARDGRSAANG